MASLLRLSSDRPAFLEGWTPGQVSDRTSWILSQSNELAHEQLAQPSRFLTQLFPTASEMEHEGLGNPVSKTETSLLPATVAPAWRCL